MLLLGDTDRSEFRRARATLEGLGQVTILPDPPSAAAALAAGQLDPDLIVVARAHPGEFSQRAVEGLRRQCPLAPVVALLGSWCEGEMRTGRPWPGTIRVYWHQWPARCARELGRIRRGERSAWGLPTTASDEERLLPASDRPGEPGGGLVAISARAYETQDWLSAAARSRGFSTVWLHPARPAHVEGARALIFAGSHGRGAELDMLRGLRVALGLPPAPHPAPVIALLDFPRIEDSRRMLADGAATVLSKPVQVDDLLGELSRVLTPSASPGAQAASGPA